MRHVSFDLRTGLCIPSVIFPVERPRCSILKTSRFGNGPRSLNPPSVVASEVLPQRDDSVLEHFASTLEIHCGDSQSIPLSSLYSQFRDYVSLSEVIQLSCQLAPCGFDMAEALEAHAADPLVLDPDIIAGHIKQVSELGLRSFLELASDAVLPLTLQPDIVSRDFSSASTFPTLSKIATDGIVTSVDPSFQANGGFNCASYDDSVANSLIICHLLFKGHKNGRFIVIPLSLAQSCAHKEN